jgi:hypothetical protein
MPAYLMRELLCGWIEKFRPKGALKSAKAAEESERQLLSILARSIDEQSDGEDDDG